MGVIWFDVDAALAEVPVNIAPLIDDTDFKSRETGITYNQAGMDLVWNFVTCAGAYTQTAVTPTTGGNYDWAHQGDGMYSIEIPASGGASINNDTEGFGWFTGICTGVLPWRGPICGFRRAAINDLLIEGSTASTNLEDFFDGTGYAGGTAKLTVDVTKWNGTNVTTPDTAGSPKVTLTAGTGTGQISLSSGAVTVGTNNDKTGYSLSSGQLTVKKNVALSNFTFPMFDTALALKTGLTVTVNISKDGGAFAASTNSAAEIGTTGWYKINFTQTEMNADIIALSCTATGAIPTAYTIITQA